MDLIIGRRGFPSSGFQVFFGVLFFFLAAGVGPLVLREYMRVGVSRRVPTNFWFRL